MPVPVIAGIASVLVSIYGFLSSAKKVVSFVIAAAVWAGFLWVIGIFISKATWMVGQVNDVKEKANMSNFTSGVFDVLDKIAYIFPIWELLAAISFYLIFCGTLLALQWLLQGWDMLPFKDSAGS